jgi:hypothetical protein
MVDKLITTEHRVIALLGTQITDGVRDFGKAIDYLEIITGGESRYIIVMDNGRKIDAASVLRFMSAYRRKMNKIEVVYPDGSDIVFRRRKMRVTRSGSHSVTGTPIRNIAEINGERINISSTDIGSSDSFSEEYNINKNRVNESGK